MSRSKWVESVVNKSAADSYLDNLSDAQLDRMVSDYISLHNVSYGAAYREIVRGWEITREQAGKK